METEKKNTRLLFSVIALIVVHTAGIIGIYTPYRDLFLSLTPVNLLLSTGLLLLNHKEFNKIFFIFFAAVIYSGFFIEVVGVRTGVIFGHYWYEETLGSNAMNVPLVIGINWFMLIYAAGVISNKLNKGILLKCISGAFLMVMLDLLIEHSAHRLGFWSWLDNIIPLRNYISWFIISFVFLYLFHSLRFNKDNKFAPFLYLVQLLFFALLCVFK